MSLLESIKTRIQADKYWKLRGKEAHNATDNLKCLRDQYWAWIGIPPTNKTDLVGYLKMGVGDYVERGLIYNVLSQLGEQGYLLEHSQLGVGGDAPKWHGYVDALVKTKHKDEWLYHAIEIKTKSGYGADLFYMKPEPSPEYMVQLGLYLKCLSEKGITNEGSFLFVLMSDKHFGTLVTIRCTYDTNTQTIHAVSYETSEGKRGQLQTSANIAEALERWVRLDAYIAKGEEPPPEYEYKYELTPEVLRDIPDWKLKKIIEGTLVFGDWQNLYSRYKDRALQQDGIDPKRTPEEIGIARAEWKRRHPRSKL